ncbi:MAG: asparagine synthase (glutamine-hydrolyzing) [Phycisphaerales bacterium]|nr:MAG: asparagine synthase (glutamine-hydrolyzing) [Phycisphaerales bacterium]
MCGIAGIWGEADVGRLRAMAEAVRHRGPDDDGFWTGSSDGIGFAHRRLSIIDLQGGRQPITNEDGKIVTMLNGEIYNYRELRDELISRGHVFKTQSDTEVIVHLYEDLGIALVDKLRGMFAIALWDDKAKQLVLIRDRVGKKPLYFSEANGEFLFGSEIKAIVAGWRGSLDLDRQALVDYLGWGMVSAPATIYQQLRSLEPGELIVVRNRRIALRKHYWQQRMLPKVELSRGEAVDKIDVLLREAVRLRLRSDVPVGAFLSGGIDSGIITAIAAQEHPGQLTTITIGFEDGSFDERPPARLVAEQYGTDHHEVLVEPDVVEDLPRIAQAYDQPFADASAIPSYYVARAARQFVKVVLNGDGGDEILAGYRRYVAARISGLMCLADGEQAYDIWQSLVDVLPVPRKFRSGYAFAHRLVRGMSIEPVGRYFAWAVDGLDKRALANLCSAGMTSARGCWLDDTASADRLAEKVLEGLGGSRPLDQMLGADFAMVLPNDLLVKMDIATMACGLEARSPLLDHELIDVVSRYPETLKLRGFTTKPLLRALSKRYVPGEIQNAPKRGFEVPLVRWLREDLRELSEDVILSRSGLLTELFERSSLERFLRGDSGLDPARWSRQVWHLLMLGMWDRCVNKASKGLARAC